MANGAAGNVLFELGDTYSEPWYDAFKKRGAGLFQGQGGQQIQIEREGADPSVLQDAAAAVAAANAIANVAGGLTGDSTDDDTTDDDTTAELGIKNDDGTVTYSLFDFAPYNPNSIYSVLENGDVIHTESGTVMTTGSEYDVSPYGIRVTFPPYVPSETESGGGGDAGSGDAGAGGDDSNAGGSSGGDAGGSSGGDVDGGSVVIDLPPEYEVIGQRSDGKWIVRQGDGEDADIWIIDGDYEIGDEVDPEDMENATRGTANTNPVRWVWDVDTSVWNPVFNDDEIDPNTGSVLISDGPDEPEDPPEIPAEGTVLSEACDVNDLIVVTADGKGGSTTTIEEGGCTNGVKNVDPSVIETVRGLLGDIITEVGGNGGGNGNGADGSGGEGTTKTINPGSDPNPIIPDPSGEIDGGGGNNIPSDIDCNSPKVSYVPTGNPIEYNAQYNSYSAEYDDECGDDGAGDSSGDTGGGDNGDGEPGGTNPDKGVVLGEECNGTTLVTSYADGRGGSTIFSTANSPKCTTGNGNGTGDGDGNGDGDGSGDENGDEDGNGDGLFGGGVSGKGTILSTPIPEIPFQQPGLTPIIEPANVYAAVGLTGVGGLFGGMSQQNAMQGSAELLGRLSGNGSSQSAQSQFGQMPQLSSLGMFGRRFI